MFAHGTSGITSGFDFISSLSFWESWEELLLFLNTFTNTEGQAHPTDLDVPYRGRMQEAGLYGGIHSKLTLPSEGLIFTNLSDAISQFVAEVK